MKDGKLVVTFDARDYLDRPVKGTAASYTATVIRNADAAKLTLNPDAFAKPEGGPPAADDFDALPDDERLLTLAHGVSAMTFAGFGSRFVATREGTVPVGDGRHRDARARPAPRVAEGRPHRSRSPACSPTRPAARTALDGTFTLDPKPDRGVAGHDAEGTVRHRREDPGDGRAVRPQGRREDRRPRSSSCGSTPSRPSPWVTPGFDSEDGEFLPDNTRHPGHRRTGKPKKPDAGGLEERARVRPGEAEDRRRPCRWSTTPPTVDLKQPGAYKLLAVTRLADGTTLQSETGVVVKSPAKLPGVVLQLDKREIDPARGSPAPSTRGSPGRSCCSRSATRRASS